MLYDGCSCDICLGFEAPRWWHAAARWLHALRHRRPKARTLPDLLRPRVISAGDLVDRLRLLVLADDEARVGLRR